MIKRNNRKGFTIVELVIVIAVIVVLAAVLIPTFAGIINKAKESADVQLVKQINDILYADAVVDGKHKTAHDAFTTLSENGIDVTRLTPTSDGRLIVWDSANDRFVLVEEEDGDEVYPDDDQTPARISLFLASDTYDASQGYSIYLTDAFDGTSLSVTTGVDVGSNPDVNSVTYTGSEEVIIRTNSERCSFSMSQGTVNHYGVALNAIVSGGTYNCFATLIDGQYASADDITDLFAGGQGTEESPYLLASTDDFVNIREVGRNTSTEKLHFKLIGDIELPADIACDVEDYALMQFFIRCSLDGNGHTLTKGFDNALFYQAQDFEIKNLKVVFDDCWYPLCFYAMGTSTYENIETYGKYNVSNNTSAMNVFVYGNANLTYNNCINYATFTGGGTNQHYNAIFAGQVRNGSNVTLTFNNCVNEGKIMCGRAAMFVANAVGNETVIVNNCKNNGIIRSIYLSDDYSPNYYCAINALTSLTVNGTEVTNPGPIAGSGVCSNEVSDTKLTITLNNDNTFKVTASEYDDVVQYELSMIVSISEIDENGDKTGGSAYFRLDEIIEASDADSYTTSLKLLKIMDSKSNSGYSDAGEINGFKLVTKDGETYYLFENENYVLGSSIVEFSSISVTAYDAEGYVVSSVNYFN